MLERDGSYLDHTRGSHRQYNTGRNEAGQSRRQAGRRSWALHARQYFKTSKTKNEPLSDHHRDHDPPDHRRLAAVAGATALWAGTTVEWKGGGAWSPRTLSWVFLPAAIPLCGLSGRRRPASSPRTSSISRRLLRQGF